MPDQQQIQQLHKPQRHKRLPRKQLIVSTIVIVALAIITVWILSSLGIIPNVWATILSTIVTVFGVVVTFLPLILSSDKPEPTTSTPPTTPQNNVQVPSTPVIPPSAGKTGYRGIVGLPPPTDPKTIQQRDKVVKDVHAKLIQPDITAIALTGIAGVGKSTLAALIYHYTEEQRLLGSEPFTDESIWLRIDPAVTMADLTGTLVKALGKPMPDLSNLSPQNQAVALFNALDTVDKTRLVILDQFENLLDWQTGHALPDRPGIGEWLDAINSQRCTCRVLVTSRPLPQGTREYPPTYMQEYHVEGLEEAEGMELLRKQGVKAEEAELRTAVARCAGHAFALTLLASILRTRKLSLTTLFKDPTYAQLWTGNIARNFLDSIHTQQLSQVQRKLLTAFSVYREPVPLNAAQAIIDDTNEVPKTQRETALDTLLAQHLLQASGEGRYQLHVIVASYAWSHFVEGDEQANQKALRAAHARAAQYYLRQAAMSCPPREQRQRSSDVHDLIEAIWQKCQAGQWQEAYNLIRDEWLFPHLNRWGGNAILLELYQLLLPSDKWQPGDSQAGLIYNNLGLVYYDLGQMKKARECLEHALQLRKGVGDHRGEGKTLNNLGRVYADLGEQEQAKEYLEQALHVRREIGDREGEATTLNNLGRVYADLGEQEQAKEYLEQALLILGKVENPRMKGATLNNLGRVYADLGEQEQAKEYLEQALHVRREIGYRGGEGKTLSSLGLVYKALGQIEQAQKCFMDALSIFRKVGDREEEGGMLYSIGTLYFEQVHYDVALACFLLAKSTLEGLQSLDRDLIQRQIGTIRRKIGKKRFDVLLARIEPQALQVVEQELHEKGL